MNLPKRKPTRLKGYDYSTPGAYFVTICTHERQELFEIENAVGNDLCVVPPTLREGTQALPYNNENYAVGNDLRIVPAVLREGTQALPNNDENYAVGNDLCVVPPPQNAIIHKWLAETTKKYNNMKIEKYVIMPNHIHAIIVITERHVGRSLHDAVRWFKTMSTNAYINMAKDNKITSFHKKLWQKSFHDHIIRDEKDYQKIWEYIDKNHLKWEKDCFYSDSKETKIP